MYICGLAAAKNHTFQGGIHKQANMQYIHIYNIHIIYIYTYTKLIGTILVRTSKRQVFSATGRVWGLGSLRVLDLILGRIGFL